jgi:hypothetical protein
MVLRTITGALLALAIAASPALACKGTEIFADDFQNDGGTWDSAEWIKIGGGIAELSLPAGYAGVMRYLGDVPKDFDMCVDVTYPATATPEGAGGVGGVGLWFTDYENVNLVATAPAGVIGAVRISKGKLVLTSPFRKQNVLKAGPNAKNTIRVTVKGNQVTVYANDQKVASYRTTPGEGALGLFAEADKDKPTAWKFSNFKLTEAP